MEHINTESMDQSMNKNQTYMLEQKQWYQVVLIITYYIYLLITILY
jgi:hypothetical protein